MRPLLALALTLLPGCGAPAPVAPVEVFVCLESCAAGVAGAEVFVDDEGPSRGRTDPTGRLAVEVTVPGTHGFEALGPPGTTMERGPDLVLDGSGAPARVVIPVYRSELQATRSVQWPAATTGGERAVAVDYAFSADEGLQLSYQHRLVDLFVRISWQNGPAAAAALVPCAGTAAEPALLEGTAEGPGGSGPQTAVLAPSREQLAPLLEALVTGHLLRLCVTGSSGPALDAVPVEVELSFVFEGKSTRRIAY